MDPSSPEGRPFQLYISYPVCPGESGTKFKKWRPVLRLLWWICWYWLIRCSVIGIWSKRLKAPREMSKKAQMMTTALSTRRPPKRKLTSPGRFGCDKPQGPWVHRCILCKQPRHWERECPQVPDSSGAPSAFDGFAVGDWQGPRRGLVLPKDTIYITSAQTRVVIGVVAHLIQFDKNFL